MCDVYLMHYIVDIILLSCPSFNFPILLEISSFELIECVLTIKNGFNNKHLTEKTTIHYQ